MAEPNAIPEPTPDKPAKNTSDEVVPADPLIANRLQMLNFMNDMRTRRRHVAVPLGKLSVVGYGPNEWMFRTEDKVPMRYKVLSPGSRASAMILREPLLSANFSTIDAFIEHMISAVKFLLDRCLVIYHEASSVSLDGRLATEPETLGVPLSDMCELEPAHENICATIQPFCITNRMRNPNFALGRVAEGIDLHPMRELLFNVARDEMRPLRNVIINFEKHINQQKTQSSSYKYMYPNDVLHILANPFNLNPLFTHLPMPSHSYSELIWELLRPELNVAPLTPSEMIINSSQSMAKLTTLNSFSTINERPMMDHAVGYYALSMLCPGSVNFMINLEDINKDDIYLRLLAALAAKLLFAYHENQRWNSLCECSVREVETAIARAGTTSGALDHVQALGAVGFPLGSVAPSHRSQLEHFDFLRTSPEGNGWRESGGARFARADPSCPYLECQPRPLFVTTLDDLLTLSEEIVCEQYAAWNTKNGVLRLLSCMARGKVMKTPLAGTETVFDMCASRLFRFFISVNDYNRSNWYTSLRPTNERANNMFDGAIDAPMIVEISGKTILYMFKSLDESSIGTRRIPYMTQLQLECAIMRDCVETYARQALLQELVIRFGIQLEHFTTKEIAALTHPRNGPLAEILENIRKNGYSGQIGPFASVAAQLSITEVLLTLNRMVINDPLQFGVSTSVILNPRIPRRRIQTLTRLSQNQRPYTNVFVQEEGAPEPNRVLMGALQRMIVSYSAKEDMREMTLEHPLRLMLPAPYQITTGSLSGAHNYPLSITYPSINRHNTLRAAVTIAPRNFCVIPINIDDLSRPDVYLKDANELESVFIPAEDFQACVESVSQWLANIHIHMNEARLITTKNVTFCSIFDKA